MLTLQILAQIYPASFSIALPCLRQIPFALGSQCSRRREALCDGDSQQEPESSLLFFELYFGGTRLSPWTVEEADISYGCNNFWKRRDGPCGVQTWP